MTQKQKKRPTAVRKIALMHQLFGEANHICGECSNLVYVLHRDKRLRKCKVYGDTNSEASDWAKSWRACGMFNQVYTGRRIIELVQRRGKEPESPLEDQIEIFEKR